MSATIRPGPRRNQCMMPVRGAFTGADRGIFQYRHTLLTRDFRQGDYLRCAVIHPLQKDNEMLSSPPAGDGHQQSILVVDDDGMIVDLLSQWLERHGAKVFRAENGLDAWNLFNNEKIDCVLTDIQMPGLDGKELSHRIRSRSPFIKIAVMSGGETDIARELLKDGTANCFFPKPFDLKNVCKSLIEETGSYYTPSLQQ